MKAETKAQLHKRVTDALILADLCHRAATKARMALIDILVLGPNDTLAKVKDIASSGL